MDIQSILKEYSEQPYLEKVKQDGIPMSTPIYPRIFNKIEEMNPLMFGEWKEETATSNISL
jgi:hypothetical protein